MNVNTGSATILILPSAWVGHHDTSPSECDPVSLHWNSDGRRPPRGKPRLAYSRDQVVRDDDLHASIDGERKP